MELLKLTLLFIIDGLVLGRPIPEGIQPFPVHFPKYEFGYAVHDGFTGDVKSQHEVRHGGNVAGHYTVLDADGRKRIVEYQADDISGFNAVVHRDGQTPSHHGNHAGHSVQEHHFHGAPAPLAIAAGHPPPAHGQGHHDHHHGEHRFGEYEGSHSHHHNHQVPPPPAFAAGHLHPVAHSSAFQNNFYQPYP